MNKTKPISRVFNLKTMITEKNKAKIEAQRRSSEALATCPYRRGKEDKAKLCPFHSKIMVFRKNKPNFHVAQPPSAVSKLRKTNPKSKRSGDPP
jgi:hypothetical protein